MNYKQKEKIRKSVLRVGAGILAIIIILSILLPNI